MAFSVGEGVGWSVGFLVGCFVGVGVGALVGFKVGLSVFRVVGFGVGEASFSLAPSSLITGTGSTSAFTLQTESAKNKTSIARRVWIAVFILQYYNCFMSVGARGP